MSKKFPCPYCKGKGSWVEPVLDYGVGPRYDCGFCDGEGMIEINGPKHQLIKELEPTNDHELLAAMNTGKPRSLIELAAAAGWLSCTGRPAKSRTYRAVIRLIAAGLVAVRRKRGRGNGGYGGRYRLTEKGQKLHTEFRIS